MNVQQSKQAKITLMAIALAFAAMLACAPQLAFASEVQAQGATDTEHAGGKTQETVAVSTQSLEAQQAVQLATTQAAPDANAVKAEEPDPIAAGSGTSLEAQAANAEQGGSLEAQVQELSAQASPNVADVSLTYDTHVQNDGWQKPVGEGEMSGTEGRALRLEGIHISLTGMNGINGSIVYQTHVQNDGWQDPVRDGAMSGTQGRALRLEGIKIWLEGDIAKHYDVFYRTHVQNDGWQGWQKNGALAGTTGRALRLEGIEIKLSAKTQAASGENPEHPSVRYEAHVQNVGWQEWVTVGITAGTTGRALRVEALNIVLSGGPYSGGIKYSAHVQNIGWQGFKFDGDTAGTTGEGKRVEALRIELTGEVAKHYDLYYRTHVPGYGWLDWACNGADSGSTGHGLRIEALQIALAKKGAAVPFSTDYPTVNLLKSTLNGIDISSWQAGINLYNVPADFVIVKATGGTGYTNPYFWSMAEDARNSGKLLGLYHFAREAGSRGSARAEADHFVDTVGSYVGNAVLILDYEAEAIDCGPGWARAWLDRVWERTGGICPMIYMSKSVTRSQDWSSVAPYYKLWVAQYPNYDTTGYQSDPWTDGYGYGAWDGPTMFQYASTGDLPGYNGNLDLNLFYGSEAEWRRIAAGS